MELIWQNFAFGRVPLNLKKHGQKLCRNVRRSERVLINSYFRKEQWKDYGKTSVSLYKILLHRSSVSLPCGLWR